MADVSGWSVRSTSAGRPATGWSGSGTKPSSTGAWRPLPLWGLCLYDLQRLPDQVIESGYRTHPQLVTPGAREANPRFMDPADYLRTLAVPVEPP
jgi:hypothetical protein